MTVVVDLGCEPQRIDRSIEPLVDRFAPDVLFGFDPAATPPFDFACGDSRVVVEESAAWVRAGTVLFSARTAIEGTIMADSSAWNGEEHAVPCFDFSTWLRDLDTPDVVVKMDIEGAEVPVLEKLIVDGNDDRISLLLVEWHEWLFAEDYVLRRANIEALLRCPVEVWH